MSIILVKKEKDRIIIGADSQETGNQTFKENIDGVKLKKIEEGVYIGGAGDAHLCSVLYAYAEKHSMSDIVSSWQMIEYFSNFTSWLFETIYDDSEDNKSPLQRCQLLLVIKDSVWQFADYYTRELREGEFSCIGSGSQAASACLHLGIPPEDALKATCKVDIYCSEPVHVIEIPIDELEVKKIRSKKVTKEDI